MTAVVDEDDLVFEDIGDGRDLVLARTTYVLQAWPKSKPLYTTNPMLTAAIDLTGNGFSQLLTAMPE